MHMRNDSITPSYVEFMPSELSEGILYISSRFKTASHKCACGCGLTVVTPLRPDKWRLTDKRGKISLRPSIGNWNFPCQSHYWISDNSIEWSYKFNKQMIDENRAADELETQRYFEDRGGKLSVWQKIKRFFFGS